MCSPIKERRSPDRRVWLVRRPGGRRSLSGYAATPKQRFNAVAPVIGAKRKWSVAKGPSGYFHRGNQSAEFPHENNKAKLNSTRTRQGHLRMFPLHRGRVLRIVCCFAAAVHHH